MDGIGVRSSISTRRRARLSAVFVTSLVAATLLALAPGTTTATADAYLSLVPARLLETRPGLNTVDGQANGIGIRTAGSETMLLVAGRAGVPANAKAVVLNVAVTGSSAAGFITAWPCGQTRPLASSLNHAAGQTISNAVTAQIGAGGQVCIYTLASTHVIVDVTGAYPSTSGFQALVPGRVLETRPDQGTADGLFAGIGMPAAGSVTELVVRNRAGAGNADAVVLNVAVTGSSAPGFVTLFPCGSPKPNAASLNYDSGQTISNAVTAKVGTAGSVCVYVFSATHVIIDLTGAFPSGGAGYDALVPGRVLETRSGLNTVDGQFNGIGIRAAGTETEVLVAGRAGVAASVDAVVLNVAVTGSSAPGFVTLFPCGSTRPNASSLNFAAGQTISNAVTAKVGTGGKICVFVFADTHVIIDVTGYFSGTGTGPIAKPKFQAVYAFSSAGRPPSGAGIEPKYAQEIRSVTNWFDTQTSGRHPDFVTDSAGAVTVITIQLTMTAAQVTAPDGWNQASEQVKAQLPADRYPVIFYDGTIGGQFCAATSSAGFVFIPIHECSDSGVPELAGFPFGPTYVIAHQLGHALGAVKSCAPHASVGAHVNDNRTDLMYDGNDKDILNTRLDPGSDDYYNPVPGAICDGGNIILSPYMS